jgi:uncharacterized protein YjcR
VAKKKIYCEEAERLYVEEQMTIQEISFRLNVSVRLINYWKKDKDWKEKRNNFIKTKQTPDLRTYYFAKRMLYRLEDDMAKGRKVSSKRLYSFTRMIDSIGENTY